MIARDARGQMLGSITSRDISTVGEFIGSLSISSDQPIASVEWWPSANNAAVYVDNLSVYVDKSSIVPEPTSAVLVLLGSGSLLFGRRARR